jgi:Phytanoyl-CoA dioxygenase (PhyH)
MNGTLVSDAQLDEWVERFHRDGYLVLHDVAPPEWCDTMRTDLDRALTENGEDAGGFIELHHRMFETSETNLTLFDLEPIVTFAERLIADCTHVVHNNSFRVPAGRGGGITTWHQDDAPHSS